MDVNEFHTHNLEQVQEKYMRTLTQRSTTPKNSKIRRKREEIVKDLPFRTYLSNLFNTLDSDLDGFIDANHIDLS